MKQHVQNKKRVIVPFENSLNAVSFDVTQLLLLLNDIESESHIDIVEEYGVVNFLQQLSSIETNLQDQVKWIQQNKGVIRSKLGSIVSYSAPVKQAVQLLTMIQVFPSLYSLRISFDWVFDLVKGLYFNFPNDVILTLNQVFSSVARIVALSATHIEERNVDEIMQLITSLNCMAIWGKDIPWIDPVDSQSDELTNNSRVITYLNIVKTLFIYNSNFIITERNHKSEANSDITDIDVKNSASLYMRHAEASAECLRFIMIIFKSRRNLYVSVTDSDEWSILFSEMLSRSSKILESDLIHKDVITSTAMCVVSIIWLDREKKGRELSSSFSSSANDDVTSKESIISSSLNIVVLSVLLFANSTYLTEIFDTNHAFATTLLSGFYNINKFPLISKCALLKAVLAVYFDEIFSYDTELFDNQFNYFFSSHISSDAIYIKSFSDISTKCLFDAVFRSIVHICNNNISSIKVYGFQTLESWLIKASTVFTLINKPSIQSNFLIISNLLLNNWNHPSRQVNHIVPTLFEKLLKISSDIFNAYASENVVSNQQSDERDEIWTSYISGSLVMPSSHRSKYQAMKMLLPYVGATLFFANDSQLLHHLLNAIKYRDIASAVASLFGSILNLTSKESNKIIEEIRNVWINSVILALTSDDNATRVNTCDYIVPEILKLDPNCVPFIISSLRDLTNHTNVAGVQWGYVSVLMHGRAIGVIGCEISIENSAERVTKEDLTSCCVSSDAEIRLMALTVLTVSNRTSSPITQIDAEILKKSFRYSLKLSEADHRHKVIRIMKGLLIRIRDSYRSSVRETKNIENKLLKIQYDERSHEYIVIISALRSYQSVMSDSIGICRWLSGELEMNIYPGASFDREVISLEIIQIAMEILGEDTPLLRNIFFSSGVVSSCLKLTTSSWDRSRKVSADVLLKFPRPLDGFDSTDKVNGLVQWGLNMTGSPRLRESDAGAMLLKNVYSIYCIDMGWELRVVSDVIVEVQADTNLINLKQFLVNNNVNPNNSLVSVIFIVDLCLVLENRLYNLTKLFTLFNSESLLNNLPSSGNDTMENFDLCHGLLLAIRLCVQQSNSSGLLGTESLSYNDGSKIVNVWQSVITHVLDASMRCLSTAMTVVAEATSDVPFAPIPFKENTAESSTDHSSMASKGPINSTTYSMAATYINTNSGMSSIENNDNIATGFDIQRGVVAAWLLVKEACSMIATLVEISPVDMNDKSTNKGNQSDELVPVDKSNKRKVNVLKSKKGVSKNESIPSLALLSNDDIYRCGSTILDALGRMKHMGAIAEAQVALQSICSTLLRHGERSPNLCMMPSMWLNDILHRLLGNQQVFILRRSAGFAYSFLSLLRAEPANCKPTLLHTALRNLLNTIAAGLAVEMNVQILQTNNSNWKLKVTTHYLDSLVERSNDDRIEWRLAVHAMNVIRLILTDGALGPDLDEYIEVATQLAVLGFSCERWAVRNSSMMVFTAVVQRAIDHDKNNSGGSSTPTAIEFFQRYSFLYPFLLKELAKITNHEIINDEINWPISVTLTATPKISDQNIHPSLYPILLLISKLKATMKIATDETDLDQQNTSSLTPKINLALFSQLIISCKHQRVFQIRTMSAKAFAAITPLDETDKAINDLLSYLFDRLVPTNNHVNQHNPKTYIIGPYVPVLLKETLEGLAHQIKDINSNSSSQEILSQYSFFLSLLCIPVVNGGKLKLRESSTAPIALQLLGWVISDIITGSNHDLNQHDLINQWLEILSISSQEDQSSSLRESCAISIELSSLFSTPFHPFIQTIITISTHSFHNTLCSLYTHLTRLLQDDDRDVRLIANRIFNAALSQYELLDNNGGSGGGSPPMSGLDNNSCPTEMCTMDLIAPLIAWSMTQSVLESKDDASLPSSSKPRDHLNLDRMNNLNNHDQLDGIKWKNMNFILIFDYLEELLEQQVKEWSLLQSSSKIFEPELTNLYVEPIKITDMLSQTIFLFLSNLINVSNGSFSDNDNNNNNNDSNSMIELIELVLFKMNHIIGYFHSSAVVNTGSGVTIGNGNYDPLPLAYNKE
eukprot:gene10809-14510_t